MFEVIRWNQYQKTILFDSLKNLKDYIYSIYGYKGRIKDKTLLALVNKNTHQISGMREDSIGIYKDKVDFLCQTEIISGLIQHDIEEFLTKGGYVWYMHITSRKI